MTLVTPSRAISIGAKDYLLDGSFATLRAIQETLRLDVVQILINVMDMRLDEIARLIAIGSGGNADEIGQAIVDATGAITPEYALLKTNLVAWLNIAITPKADREKKRAEMEAIIASQTKSSSPGPTINE